MTPSLKALIEQQALNDCVCGPGPCSHKTSYIHGATPYAEKWEAATQYTDQLKEVLRLAGCPELIIENPSFIKGKKPTDEDMKWAMQKVQEYMAEEESLKQENKRLREALEELRFNNRQGDPNSYHAIKRILDAALKPKQPQN